jgi:hypothetical protein
VRARRRVGAFCSFKHARNRVGRAARRGADLSTSLDATAYLNGRLRGAGGHRVRD